MLEKWKLPGEKNTYSARHSKLVDYLSLIYMRESVYNKGSENISLDDFSYITLLLSLLRIAGNELIPLFFSKKKTKQKKHPKLVFLSTYCIAEFFQAFFVIH